MGVGKTVTLTYTVTVKGGGDGHLRNVAFQQKTGDPGPDPVSCPSTSTPCAVRTDELPKLTITKSASRPSLPEQGGTLTYTVKVTNSGLGNFTSDDPATFSDDLSKVLDDATLGPRDATIGTVSMDGQTLRWSGVLGHGESATITYTVTYNGEGDQSLLNTACVKAADAAGQDDRCRTTQTPGSGLRHAKSVDPASGTAVVEGQTLIYTLTFENVGGADATVETSDDLADVLDDGQLVGPVVSGDGIATQLDGTSLTITGTVPAGATRTVTYKVKVDPFADQGDHVLRNELACEPGDPSTCSPATTTNPVKHLAISKSSDGDEESRAGDAVAYTVKLKNDGAGDFTALDPATVVDDLTDVLDDATFDGTVSADRGADPTYDEPKIRWTGALDAGDTVTVTYTVKLKGGGDGQVDNVACAGPDGPCADESFDLPKLTISKTSNRRTLPAVGDPITYTVTVRNDGPGDFTDANPATFTDDLSDVLDDADIDEGSLSASSGTPFFITSQLIWAGALEAGESATITYTLIYNAEGNLVVDNKACIPAKDALKPGSACRTVHTPGSGLRHEKSVDPESGTSVEVGQELTYTLTFQNVGPADASVDTSDDLADVLDDAELVDGPDADEGLTAELEDGAITVSGEVPAGKTLTVTYTVKVKEFADQDDHVLINALACEPGDPLSCAPETTMNPVRHLKVAKTANPTTGVGPGDAVHYTLTLQNDGEGDYTAKQPAAVVDDLSAVLDDATFDGEATASRGPKPSYDSPSLTWAGPLGASEQVTVEYDVVLKGGGDGTLTNVAWVPKDPTNPGPKPDCKDSDATIPCDTAVVEVPKLTISKSASRTSLPAVGDDVTYTVTVNNTGPGDYTAEHPATFSDDLADVLDDAPQGPHDITSSIGEAGFDDGKLTWTGALDAGDSATITYSVTYKGAGDHVLDNSACVPAAEAKVPAENCDTVSVPGSGLVHRKSVNPESGKAVEVGQELTYTLTFQNVGSADASVNTKDDLADVLDDADLVDGPTAADGLTAEVDDDSITVIGAVPAGKTLTVTYKVKVKDFADQDDHVLVNALACEPGDPPSCAPETTTNPVRHLVLTKTKLSPDSPNTGDAVTYELTVSNDGAGDWTDKDPASVVDDLTDVLDDAAWDDTAKASSGSVTYDDPKLSWSGVLPHGSSATVTYSVTVTNRGDHRLENVATVPDCELAACNPEPVVTPLPYVVPAKTSDPADGQDVQPGDVVTYTLTWTNEGKAAGVVDSTDDLADVLDDAELVDGPTSWSPDVVTKIDAGTLRVTGTIDEGDKVTVTYKVQVRPAGHHGNHELDNTLVPDDPQVTCSDEGDCTPVLPPGNHHDVGDLKDWKTVDPGTGTTVQEDAELTYTLHFAGTGQAPVAVDRVDDLSGVLDDADLVSGPVSSNPALQVSGPTASGKIAVSGTLGAGQEATVTYTVAVKANGDRGDDLLGNFLLDPDQQRPSVCAVADPDHPDCTVNHVSDVVVTKSSSPADGSKVGIGDDIAYTLVFRNVSQDSGAAPTEVDQTDHLDAVLDDAVWKSGPSVSNDALTATRDGDELRVTGELAPGQVTKVTYVVTVNGKGDGKIRNLVGVTGEPPVCGPDSPTCTAHVSPVAGADDPGGLLPDTGATASLRLLILAAMSVLGGAALIARNRSRRA